MSRDDIKNKGFSMVELLIVIAIMAILVGTVGTLVIPYIEKSRQAKDVQLVSALCNATMSTYADCASSLDSVTDYSLSYTPSGLIDTPGSGFSATPSNVIAALKDFSGYNDLNEIKADMDSKAARDIDRIDLIYSSSRALAIVEVQMRSGSTYNNIFLPISVK